MTKRDWREAVAILRGQEKRLSRLEEERENQGTVNKVLDTITERAETRDSVSVSSTTDTTLTWDSGDKWGEFVWD